MTRVDDDLEREVRAARNAAEAREVARELVAVRSLGFLHELVDMLEKHLAASDDGTSLQLAELVTTDDRAALALFGTSGRWLPAPRLREIGGDLSMPSSEVVRLMAAAPVLERKGCVAVVEVAADGARLVRPTRRGRELLAALGASPEGANDGDCEDCP